MKKLQLIFSRYSSAWRERRRKQMVLAYGAGVCVLLIGATLFVTKYRHQMRQWAVWFPFKEQSPLMRGEKVDTPVLQLVSLPPAKREAQLKALASKPKSLDRARARYLLAIDLLARKEGAKALYWLEDLELDYPVLAAHIALKRAQAYELMGEKARALGAWQELLRRYADEPVAAEALHALSAIAPQFWEKASANIHSNYVLDRMRHWYAFSPDQPQYWENALLKYPSHPRILEIARSRIEKNPRQPQLMLLLTRYAFDQPGITKVLDQLVSNYGWSDEEEDDAIIQPHDWEAIARGYWLDRKYGQASAAYAKAEYTPHNAYHWGLGLQQAGMVQEAKLIYKRMMIDFPKADETGSAILQLAKIKPEIEAVSFLNHAVNQFPDRAGEALLAKARTLDLLGDSEAAGKVRQVLLTQYGKSQEAAEYRWQVARSKAAAGDVRAAWQWVQPIIKENPYIHLAREAGFWAGKWASKLGRHQEARAAFEQVVVNHPQSYYAWRSAVQLGWDVGDFTTVRKLDPQVVLPTTRPPLPIGSPALKELYQLGQDRDVWTLWQAEFQNRIQPTVAEQFTDGLLRLSIGDHIEGIAKISSLEERDTPEEQAEYRKLKEQLTYWHALYPFPFLELIESQSHQHDLNPLLVTALIRQESRFEPDIRSKAGAVGLMQVMPDMGATVAKNIKLKKYALDNPKDNIKLGTWLLDDIHKLNKNNSLLAIASYNAGQGNLRQWLQDEESVDPSKDPDEFVETIPFPETKDYVKQVFGNYWNYLRLYDPQVQAQLNEHSISESTAMRP